MLRAIAHRILDNPLVFQIQQSLCNEYSNLAAAFADYLQGDGKTVLDVGCSTAACAGKIMDMKRNKYTGVDIEPRYIDLARKRNPFGAFLCHDARDLPFEGGSFDVVMFNGVFHHMDDELILSCLKEVHRVMKDDGVLLVAEPVYRRDWRISTWFLDNDRGNFIRDRAGYRSLFEMYLIQKEVTFQSGMHEFCGFIAGKGRAVGAERA